MRIITLLIISVIHSIFNLLITTSLFYLLGSQNYQEGDPRALAHKLLPTKLGSVFFFYLHSSNFNLMRLYNLG